MQGLKREQIVNAIKDIKSFSSFPDPGRVQSQTRRAFEGFASRFKPAGNREYYILWAPGRVELGETNHGDYTGIETLVGAPDLGIICAISPNSERVVRFSDKFGSLEVNLAEACNVDGDGWRNYFTTPVRRIARNFSGALRTGFDFTFENSLPIACGMSTSSATVVLNYLAHLIVNNLPENPDFRKKIPDSLVQILYTGCIENGKSLEGLDGEKGVGTKGGSQDHAAILKCKTGRVTNFVTSPAMEILEEIIFPVSIIIGDTGFKAEKTAEARERYNSVSARSFRGVEIYNRYYQTYFQTAGQIIRDLREEGYEPERRLDLFRQAILSSDFQDRERLVERFRHTLRGKERNTDFIKAMNQGEFDEIAKLTDNAHADCTYFLGNTTSPMAEMIRTARKYGALSGVVNGAGFGGSVTILAREEKAEEIVERSNLEYLERGYLGKFFRINLGPGAGLLFANSPFPEYLVSL